MKTKILLAIIYCSIIAGSIIAQTPGFNYQAVLRNAAGEIMTNADVTLHFSLIDGPTNTVIYKENQILTTDELGILTCMIGTGAVESGTFSEITGVQDLNIKIEAVLPGETGMTEIGTSKLGVIPYALYGKDEDSDPENEMQELSLEGDSLKISSATSVGLNELNYWQRTDSSYSLTLEGSENARDEPVSFEVTSGGKYTLKSSGEGEVSIFTLGQTRNINGLTIADKILLNPASELTGSDQDLVSRYHPSLDFSNKIGFKKMVGNERLIKLGDPNGDKFEVHEHGRSYESGARITDEGCSYFGAYNNIKMFNAFSDLTQGAVGADLYKLGINQFGMGFAVFCPSTTNTQERSIATFGGTFSTANDNGLTTLVGALPGLDPTNGYNIIFNGQNLGVSSTINSELAGTSSTYGANGQINTTAGTFAGDADGGALITYDQSGNTGAYVWTKNDGTSQVGADQFVMTAQPPGRSGEIAAFSAPVGGEAAAYDRGTATLFNGEATVICPEHFGWVADANSMTVTITPLSADSKGIAVIEKSNGGFKVKELNGGTGNYSFDYLVMCKRKGLEEYEVVRKKPQIMPDNSTEILKNLPSGPLSSIRDLVPKKSSN